MADLDKNLREEMKRALADFKQEQMERDRAIQMLLEELMRMLKNLKETQAQINKGKDTKARDRSDDKNKVVTLKLGHVETMFFVSREQQDREEAELGDERIQELEKENQKQKELRKVELNNLQENMHREFRGLKKELEEREMVHLVQTEELLIKIKNLERNQSQIEEDLSDAMMDSEKQTGEMEEQDNTKAREMEEQLTLKVRELEERNSALLQHICELQANITLFVEREMIADSMIQVLEKDKMDRMKEREIWKKQRMLWKEAAEKCLEGRKSLEKEREIWKKKLREAMLEIQSMKYTKSKTDKCKLKELEQRNAELHQSNSELQASIKQLQEGADMAVIEHMDRERKSWEKERKSWEKDRESWEKERESWEKERESWEKERESWEKKKASEDELGSHKDAKKQTDQGTLQQNVTELQDSFQQPKEVTERQ
ncbi:golgin subfamily A member 6-like protein 2 isoform X2 [Tachysurus fulvidraco]|uniref:golgin subfamily A member 6-like protein 2 isoform X2 n=1 Tax=Tachysurus fulvidraco TaxID=1234273 RepID=UPI001FEE7D89|nr:golgin subfamily A member 6-like protein 2 isoform X2 [Tachysurus fulvidraco]